MDDTQIEVQARLHDEARRTAQQIDPVTVQYPEMTIDDAYAIQKRWLQIELERGRVLIGHKIGLTSRAMQLAMNIDEPDSRQRAAYPLSFVMDNKFWPSVRRLDEAFGDRNLICSCTSTKDYAKA